MRYELKLKSTVEISILYLVRSIETLRNEQSGTEWTKETMWVFTEFHDALSYAAMVQFVEKPWAVNHRVIIEEKGIWKGGNPLNVVVYDRGELLSMITAEGRILQWFDSLSALDGIRSSESFGGSYRKLPLHTQLVRTQWSDDELVDVEYGEHEPRGVNRLHVPYALPNNLTCGDPVYEKSYYSWDFESEEDEQTLDSLVRFREDGGYAMGAFGCGCDHVWNRFVNTGDEVRQLEKESYKALREMFDGADLAKPTYFNQRPKYMLAGMLVWHRIFNEVDSLDLSKVGELGWVR